MSMESEIKAKFGGFWNSIVLLLVIVICLRFSSLELAAENLVERVHCALHLFLGCVAAGVLLGILRIFLAFSNQTYTRAPASANFAQGIDIVNKIASIPTGSGGPFSGDVPKSTVIIEDIVKLPIPEKNIQ